MTEVVLEDRDAELQAITKVYPGGERAVDDVSFSILRGEFFALLGPSGSGKSTTLRMLAGLEQPTSGRILIGGVDATRVPPNKRPTNLIFQKLALFPHLTVEQNIGFGPRLRRAASKEVRSTVSEMVELVELGGYEGRLPSQLSGGQQQRVAIARALANRPTVLLLDEPLGALDLRLREQMQTALKKIQRDSGTTFVIVTHDQTEAFGLADRLAVMNRGRVEQLGTPADLYKRPASEFVATFLGDTNLLHGRVADGHLETETFRCRAAGVGAAISIRPELIAIGDHLGDSYDNVFPAVITELTFQGASVRLRVRPHRIGQELSVTVPSADPRGHTLGDNVEIGWSIDSAVTIPDPAPPVAPTER